MSLTFICQCQIFKPCMVSATVQYYGAKLLSAKVSSLRSCFHKFSFKLLQQSISLISTISKVNFVCFNFIHYEFQYA